MSVRKEAGVATSQAAHTAGASPAGQGANAPLFSEAPSASGRPPSSAQQRFGERLRDAMRARGLKQADLIRLASERGGRLGKSQVSQYVSGKTLPRPDVMRLLAGILDVSSAWLEGTAPAPDPALTVSMTAFVGSASASGPAPSVPTAGPAPAKPAPASSAASAPAPAAPPGSARATGGAPCLPSVGVRASVTCADASAALGAPASTSPVASVSPAPEPTFGRATALASGLARDLTPGAPGNPSAAPDSQGSAPMTSVDPTSGPVPTTDPTCTPEPVPTREFARSSKLAHVEYDVRGPVADQAAKMEAEGLRVLKLNIGNPAPFGFRTPDEVVQDMAHQLTECEGYSDTKGLFSARKAIMQYAQIKGLPNVGMGDIYTGNGVSELINLTLTALLDTGDEILIPAPDYPLWTACASLAGGTPVHYICDEQADWNPDIADIERKITPRTKAIVLINPNNPTGAVYSREILEQIVEIARRHQLMILSDEIYDRLVMDGIEHISIASLAPDLPCITYSGLSKSHMIAGWRIGWMILSGNKEAMSDFIAGIHLLSNMRLCSNVPAQSIVQTALGGHQSVKDYIRPGGRIYEQREYVYQALNEIPGISVVKPKAAFYIFPKMDVRRFNITDDEKFAMDLLREKRILITRGRGFNWPEPDHFRIVYLPRIDALREAMGDLRDFFAHYRQR